MSRAADGPPPDDVLHHDVPPADDGVRDPAATPLGIGDENSPTAQASARARRTRRIARASLWGVVAQFTPLAVNIALTPYVIHGFGLSRYGLFLLAAGLTFFLSSFDGGITASAQRYFSIFAGRGDKHETTRLLGTTLVMVGVVATALAAAMAVFAPTLVRVLDMPPELRGEAIFMVRGGAALLMIGLLRGLPVGILQAHNRFALTNITVSCTYAIYAGGLILTVHNGWGLRGAILTMIVQQLVATLVLVPASARYLTRSGWSLYSRAELKEFLAFSFKMQLANWSNLFMAEVNGLIIAAVRPVGDLALFTSGAGFVEQIRTVPTNAIAPIQTALSHSYAAGGDAAMYPEFQRLQRIWILAISGWSSAAIGAAYYGVTSWLGNDKESFHLAGIVASCLMIGSFCFLGTRVLTTALNVVGAPGFQARMSVVMVSVSITLTLCLVWFGILGVVVATAVAQISSALWLEWAVRHRHPVRMRSFFREIPVVACLATIAVVLGLEWLIHPWVPHGALGLLMCAVPAAPGLLLYARLALSADLRGQAKARVLGKLRRGAA